MSSDEQLVTQIQAYRLERTKGDPRRLENYGFKIYSQSDEDGIIREIFRRIGTTNKVFIEFGAEVGLETNSRLLLTEGWRGLYMEGNPDYAPALRTNCREDLTAGNLQFIPAFVTRENINDLIASARIGGEIDFLSVDIDGNDYHVFEAIDVIAPRAVCLEHNSDWGATDRWIMPYDPNFKWAPKQPYDPNTGWKPNTEKEQIGASISSMTNLANQKGYELVGCGLYSGNGFYVRRDLIGDQFKPPFTPECLFNHAFYPMIVKFPVGYSGS